MYPLVATIEFQGRLVKSHVRQTGERVDQTADERAAAHAEGLAYTLNVDEYGLGIPEQKFRQYKLDKIALIRSPITGAKRGRITRFSRKSRKRLIDLTARMRSDVGGVMVTLTYRKNMRDYALAKSHLNEFLKYIARMFPNAPVLWRMERQQRGAIHFHLLVFGKVWFNKHATEKWQQITCDESYPDFEYLDGQRAILSYVSKYVAKLDASRLLLVALALTSSNAPLSVRLLLMRLVAVWVFGLDIEPYFPAMQQQSTGRYWGYRNKKHLPYAPLKAMVWYYSTSKPLVNSVYYRYKRYVRRSLRGKAFMPLGFSGFTLYGDAEQWYRLWCYNVCS